mmetsp:Transcript_2521/g.7835  ORF Transcript_2521/g.7835 Transcript_2521/m.7835 type:complete len:221 (-) Transcript_2521:867-1529(-)
MGAYAHPTGGPDSPALRIQKCVGECVKARCFDLAPMGVSNFRAFSSAAAGPSIASSSSATFGGSEWPSANAGRDSSMFSTVSALTRICSAAVTANDSSARHLRTASAGKASRCATRRSIGTVILFSSGVWPTKPWSRIPPSTSIARLCRTISRNSETGPMAASSFGFGAFFEARDSTAPSFWGRTPTVGANACAASSIGASSAGGASSTVMYSPGPTHTS